MIAFFWPLFCPKFIRMARTSFSNWVVHVFQGPSSSNVKVRCALLDINDIAAGELQSAEDTVAGRNERLNFNMMQLQFGILNQLWSCMIWTIQWNKLNFTKFTIGFEWYAIPKQSSLADFFQFQRDLFDEYEKCGWTKSGISGYRPTPSRQAVRLKDKKAQYPRDSYNGWEC